MQDGQMSRFLRSRGFIDYGAISYNKPNAQRSLWQILESNVTAKYFLSRKACEGILRRAERRGKALPAMLEAALRQVCEPKRNAVTEPTAKPMCQ